jgi:hypothetical protein
MMTAHTARNSAKRAPVMNNNIPAVPVQVPFLHFQKSVMFIATVTNDRDHDIDDIAT